MVAYSFYETDNRVRRYAEALVKRGDQVDAIALRREGDKPFEVLRGVNVYRIQKRVKDEKEPIRHLIRLLIFLMKSAWALTVRHLKAPYNTIHVHSVPDFEVFATIVPRLLGAKVILDIHDIIPEFYASKFQINEHSIVFRLLAFVEKLSAAYSNHVIISNDLWRDKITQRSVRPEKCTAIINYPDPSIFYPRPRSKNSNGQFVACYPGSLNWHQGVDLAISALALLRDKMPNFKLLIIGDGEQGRNIETMIKRQKLEGRAAMQGPIPIEEVAEIMASIDLGVVPKRRNTFGDQAFSTKTMEFMAMGVPIVVARTQIDQYYFNDDLVQFFEPENIEDLAAKMLELACDSSRRNTLRENGMTFIRHNNWDTKKGEYLDLVDRLVSRRR